MTFQEPPQDLTGAQKNFTRAAQPITVTRDEYTIADANNDIENAQNPIVIITKDFLNNYGYEALGWFSNGIPFAFESQRARDLVPSDYGQWVDEPVNNHPKIFDPIQSHASDKIIIVGKSSAPMECMIAGYSEIKESKLPLHDITPNMRAFNFSVLRPPSAEGVKPTPIDPRAIMDLCRAAGVVVPKRLELTRSLGCV